MDAGVNLTFDPACTAGINSDPSNVPAVVSAEILVSAMQNSPNL